MTQIERDSPLPLYHQLKQLLADSIANGTWQPGDMLPTEEQFQEQYELSRTTVRLALRELELEGHIKRYRGRGTFVSKPKISHSPDPAFSLTTYLRQQGMRPGWRVLSAGIVAAPDDVAKRLALEPETEVYRLRRLRLANEEPIGYHVAHTVLELAKTIDEPGLDQGGSLHYLRQGGQLDESYANRTIEAVPASEKVARLLDVVKGSPLMLIRRRIFNGKGVPVEDMRAFYRGDSFQYRVWQWPRR